MTRKGRRQDPIAGSSTRSVGVETVDHRRRELAFQRAHPEAFVPLVGQWVALEGETIVAHGDDPVRVVTDARSKGVRVPYVFYVDKPEDDVVQFGL